MKYMYIYNMFWGDVPCGFGPNLIAQTWSKKSMNLGTAIALDFAAHVQCEPKWIQWHDASRNLCLALTSWYLLNGSETGSSFGLHDLVYVGRVCGLCEGQVLRGQQMSFPRCSQMGAGLFIDNFGHRLEYCWGHPKLVLKFRVLKFRKAML